MSTLTTPVRYAPGDVERLSRQDGKHYELIEGQLRAKPVGTRALYIAFRICERFNQVFHPAQGVAFVEAMVYCFGRPDHGRKPDVAFVWKRRLPGGRIPEGDLMIPPDVVVEVFSPGNTAIEMDEKLSEYFDAGVPTVWMVNPEPRTIRVYRNDGTTQLFRAGDTIAHEPLLPGFDLLVKDVFPQL